MSRMGYAFKISINVQITLSVRPQNALANESPYVSRYTRHKIPRNIDSVRSSLKKFEEVIRFEILLS